MEYYQDEYWKQKEATLDYNWQEIEIWLQETTFIKDKVTWLWQPFDNWELKYTLLRYGNSFVHIQVKDELIKDKDACHRPQDMDDIQQITS